jgi:hypothetical protein
MSKKQVFFVCAYCGRDRPLRHGHYCSQRCEADAMKRIRRELARERRLAQKGPQP